MVRLRFAAATAALVLVSALPVAAQTINEYQDALRNVPVTDATPARLAQACATVANFAEALIPDASPETRGFLPGFLFSGADQGLTAGRLACVEARAATDVVVFDDKSNTPLLSPLQMEDPNKAYAVGPLPDLPLPTGPGGSRAPL